MPQEDRHWLEFVQQYNYVLEEFPHLVPLRRSIHANLHSSDVVSQPSLWRLPLRLGRQRSLAISNMLRLRKAEVLIFQDIDRVYFAAMINSLTEGLQRAELSSLVVQQANLPAQYPVRVIADEVLLLPAEATRASAKIAATFGTPDFGVKAERLLRAYYGYRCVFQRVLRWVNPKAIVFVNDQLLPSATLAQVAREAGIESFVLQHGAANPYQYPLQASKLLAWGEVDEEYFVRLGMQPEDVIVAGSLRHDIFSYRPNERPTRRCILLISNGNNDNRNGELPRLAYDWLRRLNRETNGQYEISVRYHPQEKEKYRALGDAFDHSLNDMPIETAIAHADLVVGYVSTALLESVLIGRPVIQLLHLSARGLCDFWQRGVTIKVDSYNAFAQKTALLMKDDRAYWSAVADQRQHITRFFCCHPNARQSVAEAIRTAIEC